MKLAAALIAGVLLLCSTAGVGYLVARAASYDRVNSALPAAVVAQADKLWAVTKTFHDELDKVTNEAQYPNDSVKEQKTTSLRSEKLNFELARSGYINFQKKSDVDGLVRFVDNAWRVLSTDSDFSSYDFTKIPAETKPYANMGKLKSAEGDFYVLATSLMKDIK